MSFEPQDDTQLPGTVVMSTFLPMFLASDGAFIPVSANICTVQGQNPATHPPMPCVGIYIDVNHEVAPGWDVVHAYVFRPDVAEAFARQILDLVERIRK